MGWVSFYKKERPTVDNHKEILFHQSVLLSLNAYLCFRGMNERNVASSYVTILFSFLLFLQLEVEWIMNVVKKSLYRNSKSDSHRCYFYICNFIFYCILLPDLGSWLFLRTYSYSWSKRSINTYDMTRICIIFERDYKSLFQEFLEKNQDWENAIHL